MVKDKVDSCFNHRIEIYPPDNVIHLLKNGGRGWLAKCVQGILFFTTPKADFSLSTKYWVKGEVGAWQFIENFYSSEITFDFC